MSQTHIHNAVTGETVVRDLTDDETVQLEHDVAEAQAQEAERRDNDKRAAYATESDPLFFKWQRGEGTEQAWLDKVAEIQARYPLAP
jgi:hypothetical protein